MSDESYLRILQKVVEQTDLTVHEEDPDVVKQWHARQKEASDARKPKKSGGNSGITRIWPYEIRFKETGGGWTIKLYYIWRNRDEYLASVTGLDDFEFRDNIAKLEEIIRQGGMS